MRKSLIACLFILTGCVSQSQPGMLSDNFDTQEAAKTRMSLGLTYLKNGEYSQAKKNLDKALEFGPRMAQVHYAMAYYYQTVEDKPRAVEFFENAMSLAPRDADIANSYGAYLCEQGEYEEANTYFTRAVRNQRYANAVLTYENMGICASQRGFHDDAINYFNDALNHQPSRTKTLYLLTQEYVATQRWGKAAETLKRYEKVSRISPDSLLLAVEIARGQKDLESQRAYGEMLLSMFPDSEQASQYEAIRTDRPVLKRTRKAKVVATPSPSAPSEQSEKLPQDEKQVVEQQVNSTEPAKVSETSEASETRLADTNNQPEKEATISETPESEVISNSASEEVSEAQTDTASSSQQKRYHIVQASENLYRLSVKYNIKMSTLLKWNQLTDSDLLEAGTRLWLVPPEQQTN